MSTPVTNQIVSSLSHAPFPPNVWRVLCSYRSVSETGVRSRTMNGMERVYYNRGKRQQLMSRLLKLRRSQTRCSSCLFWRKKFVGDFCLFVCFFKVRLVFVWLCFVIHLIVFCVLISVCLFLVFSASFSMVWLVFFIVCKIFH